jgi:hypothetical protein
LRWHISLSLCFKVHSRFASLLVCATASECNFCLKMKKNSWTIDMMLSTPSTRTPCIQWCVGLQHLIAKSFFLWWHTNSQRFKIKLGSKGQTTKSVIADWDWKECLVYKIMQPPLLWLKDLYFHCLPSFRKARVALMATYEARVSQVNSSPFCSPPPPISI